MPRFGGLFSRSSAHSSSTSLASSSFNEVERLEDALRGAMLILNDDLEGAEKVLHGDDSAFHKLGGGIVGFLKATMGMEQEVMKEASERLAVAETSALEAQRRSQRDAGAYHSEIYAPGTEYALCYAMSQIMSAVVGVLNESLTESLKGFYKLRKAYAALDGIAASERQYLERKGIIQKSASSSALSRTSLDRHLKKNVVPGGFESDEEEQEDEFYDADETRTATDHNKDLVNSTQRLSIDSPPHTEAAEGPDPTFFTHPVDAFIHSGTALNYGLLLTLISIIPPAFSKVLNIIGFRGDRPRGLALLWQATKFNNINGAIAGLALLGYYTNVVSFADIRPPHAYPKERCKALLETMRSRFPQSRLWLFEAARMRASERQVEQAVAMMQGSGGSSKLKQVEALQHFELSLNYMYLHEYAACAASFIKCVQLNNWSHGLYYYIAGSAHVELYRDYKYGAAPDAAKAKAHADKAEELLAKVPEAAGRKKFMARQMPFDVFVGRKVAKWMARAKELDVRLVDAAGVSPIEEVMYFWGGHKRMRPEQLEQSLVRLAWSDGRGLLAGGGMADPRWGGQGLDEKAILVLLRAAVLRHLGRREEAKEMLRAGIIDAYKWEDFKGGFKDNWPAPVARYEMAVNLWQDRGNVSVPDAELLSQCCEWIEAVAKWERFDLDARIGIKVTTARSTLRDMGYGVAL